MKAKVKKLVDASVAIQNIIIDAANRSGELSEEQKKEICKLMNESFIDSAFDSMEERTDYFLNFLNKPNLTKGSNSLAAAFDPVDAVEAYQDELSDSEFESLLEYAEKMRVAYWNF